MADFSSLNGYNVKDASARLRIGEIQSDLDTIQSDLNTKLVKQFDTVDAMINGDLIAGNYVKTKGYQLANDGNGAEYLIREKTVNDHPNGTSIIQLDDATLVAELITTTEYLPITYEEVRYQGETDRRTTIYYSIIPAEFKPELTIANDTIDTVEEPGKNAMKSMATLCTNIGACDPETGLTKGIIIKDGELLHSDTSITSGSTLYMLNDGTLNSTASDTPTAEVVALNPKWAVMGWRTLVKDGSTVDLGVDDTPAPRTFIGQDANGNYLVGVCSGREYTEGGLYYRDIEPFMESVGFTPYFAFAGDGGGSSVMIYKGKRVNKLVDYENRSVANFLVFKSKTAKNKAIFESDYQTNLKFIEERMSEKPNQQRTFINAEENVTLNANSNVMLVNDIVILNLDFTTSENKSAYANLLTNLPTSAESKFFGVINTSTNNVYQVYIHNSGALRVAGGNTLPAGSYHGNITYVQTR